jgi:predicted Holliday junction resolvase-like endonuclease
LLNDSYFLIIIIIIITYIYNIYYIYIFTYIYTIILIIITKIMMKRKEWKKYICTTFQRNCVAKSQRRVKKYTRWKIKSIIQRVRREKVKKEKNVIIVSSQPPKCYTT